MTLAYISICIKQSKKQNKTKQTSPPQKNKQQQKNNLIEKANRRQTTDTEVYAAFSRFCLYIF